MAKFSETVTLVTGGSRGIGRGIVEALLEAGGKVAATGRNKIDLESLQRDMSTDCLFAIPGDATNVRVQRKTVSEVVKRFGHITGLVNNVGLHDSDGPILADDDDRFARTLHANVITVRGWAREVSHQWTEKSPGAVVNVSSIAGIRGEPLLGVYGVSKAAQIHLSQQLALEMAPRARVNAVAPGFTLTDATKDLPEELVHFLEEKYPLGRVARPSDVAHAVLFLLSDESHMITGQTLVVDGGFGLTTSASFMGHGSP